MDRLDAHFDNAIWNDSNYVLILALSTYSNLILYTGYFCFYFGKPQVSDMQFFEGGV